MFDDILDDAINMFGKDPSKLGSGLLSTAIAAKTVADIIPGPAADLASGLLGQESFDIAEQKGRRTASNLFGTESDRGVVPALGGIAGVTGNGDRCSR